jgi:hypothetical protein
MADTDESFHLRFFALATFHAASFVVVVVMFFHLRGFLPAALERLGTATGFAAFGLFWTTTSFATRRGLRNVQFDHTLSESFVASTVVAAGWNGLYVFIVLLAGLLFVIVREPLVGSVPAVFLIVSTIGSLAAFVIGGLVGLLYGLVDAALLRIGAALFRWAAGSSSRGSDDSRLPRTTYDHGSA